MSKIGLSVISASANENSDVSSSVSGAVNFISVFLFGVWGDSHKTCVRSNDARGPSSLMSFREVV